MTGGGMNSAKLHAIAKATRGVADIMDAFAEALEPVQMVQEIMQPVSKKAETTVAPLIDMVATPVPHEKR